MNDNAESARFQAIARAGSPIRCQCVNARKNIRAYGRHASCAANNILCHLLTASSVQ